MYTDSSREERPPDQSGPLPTPRNEGGRSHIVTVADHQIHSREFGDEGRTLVFLHGLSGSSRWWSRNIPELARHYRIVVPDLLGFGLSRGRRRIPPIDQAANVFLDWIATLEADNIGLIGHSMGGQIAIHIAARRPEWLSQLVLVDAAGLPRPLTPRKLLRYAVEAGPMWRWGDPRFLPTIARDAITAGPIVLARAIWHIARDDVSPLLSDIEVPTLIVWGERDTLVPLSDAWQFREAIPNAQVVVLRGAAHNPMIDRPSDFNRILMRFLNGDAIGR